MTGRGPAHLATLALAIGLASGAAPARAQRGPGYRVALTAAVRPGNDPVTATVLIGSAGQLYRPTGEGSWRRTALGGVSIDVVGAIAGQDTLFVFGRGTPLFRYQDDSWDVDPLPNRGPIGFATSGAPVITIGRHVYLLSGHRFTRIASAWPHSLRSANRAPPPGGAARWSLVAVWASDARRIYAAGEDGRLGRYDGKDWTEITHALPATDRITSLVGVAGKQLVALTAAGGLLDVGPRTAKPFAADPTLAGFQATLACPDPIAGDGAVLVAGSLTGEAGTRWVLARARARKLELVEPLPDPKGETFTVFLGDPSGGLLVATRSGRVFVRGPEGWSEGRVTGELPAASSHSPAGRPARTP